MGIVILRRDNVGIVILRRDDVGIVILRRDDVGIVPYLNNNLSVDRMLIIISIFFPSDRIFVYVSPYMLIFNFVTDDMVMVGALPKRKSAFF